LGSDIKGGKQTEGVREQGENILTEEGWSDWSVEKTA
jgi:hypothetical protein